MNEEIPPTTAEVVPQATPAVDPLYVDVQLAEIRKPEALISPVAAGASKKKYVRLATIAAALILLTTIIVQGRALKLQADNVRSTVVKIETYQQGEIPAAAKK